jgi:pseudouridine kinase
VNIPQDKPGGFSWKVSHFTLAGEKAYQPALKTEVVDSSGAGDAFFSGTVAGLSRNLPLGKVVVLGARLASLTIQSEENTCYGTPIG